MKSESATADAGTTCTINTYGSGAIKTAVTSTESLKVGCGATPSDQQTFCRPPARPRRGHLVVRAPTVTRGLPTRIEVMTAGPPPRFSSAPPA